MINPIGFVIVVLLAVLAPCFAAVPDQKTVLGKVDSGIELLNNLYWSPTLQIWLDRPGDDIRAHYEGRLNPPWWSSANAVEMLIDQMKVTGGSAHEERVAGLYELNRNLYQKRPRIIEELKRRNQWSAADEERAQRRGRKAAAEPSTTDYYTEFRNEYLDDTGWWGVAWLKMYDRTHDPKYLSTAKAIHAHMAKNWRPDKNGGIMWNEEEEKLIPNAITNSLFLILSARLYERTGEAGYLRWAEYELDWFHERKLYDGTGVVDVPGHIGDYWTYNQGAFIGGLTALYQATGKETYLEEAIKVTGTVLKNAGLTTPEGVLLEKLGTSGWDPGLFKGICIRYLAHLRDVLDSKGMHPETAREIDRCIQASVASLLRHGVGEDGQYTIEWHESAKDRTRNFNTHLSALTALIALLPDKHP